MYMSRECLSRPPIGIAAIAADMIRAVISAARQARSARAAKTGLLGGDAF
jgi:hypothetical protein